MDNRELLQKIETSHQWTAQTILNLRELIKNEEKFTGEAISEIQEEILRNIQLNISEMEILALELESEYNE